MLKSKPVTGDVPLRIAIVDDEAMLLRVLERYLSLRGHQVEVFESGRSFLATWPVPRVYDLVLLDICMPNMNGLELLDEMSTKAKTLPRIVVISGYDCTGRLPQEIKNRRVSFLPKPFRMEALVNLIHNQTP